MGTIAGISDTPSDSLVLETFKMSVPNWRSLVPNDVGILGPKEVLIYDGKNYDTLLVASNNSNNVATGTVNAFTTLARYYQAQGITTRVYGLSATPGTNMLPVLNALGWTTSQCNPIVAWVRQGGSIDPVYYSKSKAITSSDLDTLMRANSRHDPQLDLIPPYESPTAQSTTSKFASLDMSQMSLTDIAQWIVILVVLYLVLTRFIAHN